MPVPPGATPVPGPRARQARAAQPYERAHAKVGCPDAVPTHLYGDRDAVRSVLHVG